MTFKCYKFVAIFILFLSSQPYLYVTLGYTNGYRVGEEISLFIRVTAQLYLFKNLLTTREFEMNQLLVGFK